MQKAVTATSLREVASQAEVSHGTLHNLLEKGYLPYPPTLSKLERWAEQRGFLAAEREGSDSEDAELDDAAERIVLAEHTARFLGGMAPPGEQKEIKVDILELTRRALENMGTAVPEWWYVLRGKVETGEL